MGKRIYTFAALVLAVLGLPAWALAAGYGPVAPPQERISPSLEVSSPSLGSLGSSHESILPGVGGQKGPQKLEPMLAQLYQAYVSAGIPSLARAAQERGVNLEGDSLRAIIVGYEEAPSTSGILAQKLQAVGALVEKSYGNLFQALVPAGELESLAGLPQVQYVRLPYTPVAQAIISEGFDGTGTAPWHSAGFKGRNIKVAVLDTGFDGYWNRLGTDLPSAVVVKSFREDGDITGLGNEHGTAVAEVVFDVAPEATFYLVNFSTEVEMGKAVDWLIQEKIDIITSAVGWPGTGPGNGTGLINGMVKKARDNNILWVQAAGNFAQTHWAGFFQDSDGNGFHNFAPMDEGNTFAPTRPGKGEIFFRIEIILTWDDWDKWENDYDLFLMRSNEVVAQSTAWQNGTAPPLERIVLTTPTPGEYWVAIQRFAATKRARFDLYINVDYSLEYQTAAESLVIPGDSPYALTVGAVPYNDGRLENFSSQGPTKDGRVKPDLVAPDGVSTITYGIRGFVGTSASTPHVAGAAALVKEAYPWLSPDVIRGFLESRASATSTTRVKNNQYGSGNLNLGPVPVTAAIPLVVKGRPAP